MSTRDAAARFDLSGRVALVTGASKGLGKAMARGLVEAGADVFIVARNEEELEAALADILAGTQRRGGYAVADLADRTEAARVVAEAQAKLGAVDIVVSNAGTVTPHFIDEVTDEAWDDTIAVHLTAAMALTRAAVPAMKERGWGRIVYTTSTYAVVAAAGRSSYAAAKSALGGLARASASDLGPHGITVNCLAPGPFLTELVLRTHPSAEARQKMVERTALGRWGAPPEDLVGPLLLLASDAGSFITGTTLVVDGGWLAR